MARIRVTKVADTVNQLNRYYENLIVKRNKEYDKNSSKWGNIHKTEHRNKTLKLIDEFNRIKNG